MNEFDEAARDADQMNDPRYYKNADAFDAPVHNVEAITVALSEDLDNSIFDDTGVVGTASNQFRIEYDDGTAYRVTVEKESISNDT